MRVPRPSRFCLGGDFILGGERPGICITQSVRVPTKVNTPTQAKEAWVEPGNLFRQSPRQQHRQLCDLRRLLKNLRTVRQRPISPLYINMLSPMLTYQDACGCCQKLICNQSSVITTPGQKMTSKTGCRGSAHPARAIRTKTAATSNPILNNRSICFCIEAYRYCLRNRALPAFRVGSWTKAGRIIVAVAPLS
jgi:hypothetical protein